MQFNSLVFALFFPTVLFVYFIIPKKMRGIWLLVASYAFYMRWNARYAVLIGGSTLVTYVSGLLIDRFAQEETVQNPQERDNEKQAPCEAVRIEGKTKNRKQKIVLVLCILLNLAVLAVFKYGNFAIESINGLFDLCHIPSVDKRLNLLLPVGISFYTFQALGYIIDVYRQDVEVERNLPRYALFVSFFPQLVAGPIERSKNLLTQMRHISEIKLWNAERITSGAILMVWGYFMKMMIADRIAIFVDNVYDSYDSQVGVFLLLAGFGFAIQIYCDFGSYSAIAIGAAKIMGFELMENFSAPYFSHNIKEFWSRWHISLSTWFRDYLYIPLGGNRKGRYRKARNVLLVFLVSGLWHGANWSFVLWGGIHGIYQVVGDLTKGSRDALIKKLRIRGDSVVLRCLSVIVTFCLVTFAWLFFRADSITTAFRILRRIVREPSFASLTNGSLFLQGLSALEWIIFLVSVGLLALFDGIYYFEKQRIDTWLLRQKLWIEWGVLILFIVMIFVFGMYGPAYNAQQFIYFQF